MAVLFVESFSLDSGKTDSYNKDWTRVGFPNKCVLQSLNIAFIIANSADPDEMQQTFRGFDFTKGLFPNIIGVQSSKSHRAKKQTKNLLV